LVVLPACKQACACVVYFLSLDLAVSATKFRHRPLIPSFFWSLYRVMTEQKGAFEAHCNQL
jgi:hypothetical protein